MADATSQRSLPFCDCHVHFWTHATHSWLQNLPSYHPVGDMSALREKGFSAEQYLREAASVPWLDQSRLLTVHVQGLFDAGDDLAETQWLASLAAETGHPSGIVAYVDLTLPAEDVAARLRRHAEVAGGRRLRGVRQSLKGPHPEKPDLHTGPQLLDSEAFRANLRLLAERGLVFDLQLAPKDWGRVHELVREIPSLTFVLEHCGLPFAADTDAWRPGMALLAACPNVLLKLSGFAIFDNKWTPSSVRAVVRECLDFFGEDRCMFALDFPVDRLRGSYAQWLEAYLAAVSDLGEGVVEKLFYSNAVRAYGLQPSCGEGAGF